MFIRVESSSGVPITRQVADQIRSHCASGTLAPGDRLPSVRQLAKEILVNQNTIPRGRVKVQRELLASEVDRLAHRALDLGVEPDEIHELLDESLARLGRERADASKGRKS
jgi:DNA-binding transcriptional regulator YhcF (GntR family)